MTVRDRILAVYRGDTPDCVPCMLDLSHWFYHKRRMAWDLSEAFEHPERELIEYHKQMGAGFYMPNLACFFTADYPADVLASVDKNPAGTEITWTLETPHGAVRRKREWKDQTYAWGVTEWGVRTEQDLRVLAYALGNRTFTPRWDCYRAWVDAVGDHGIVYMPSGYSAIGHLLNYWMGVEGTLYATFDWPIPMRDAVDRINENCLQCIDLLVQSPAEVIIMGDNFSSDIQPPHFFDEWSKSFYAEAIRRIHAAGKFVAVHIDGKLRHMLDTFRGLGADCADAVTPTPMGDLDPEACREEGGDALILSGGVAPNLWLPETDTATFEKAVLQWLGLKKHGPRLIANAGDQVPPGAVENRITLMRDLVERHGRY